MKKGSMNIGERDKKMLVILLAAVVIYALYHFFLMPALEQRALLSQDQVIAGQDLKRVAALIEQHADLREQESAQEERLTEKYSVFFDDLHQERLLKQLDALITESGLNVTAYEMSRTLVAPITVDVAATAPLQYPLLQAAEMINPSLAEEPAASAGNKGAEADVLLTADVLLSFEDSSYPSVIRFMQLTRAMGKSVLVKRISIAKVETGVGGDIVLSFYALPKPNDSGSDFLSFQPVLPRGKTDPFN